MKNIHSQSTDNTPQVLTNNLHDNWQEEQVLEQQQQKEDEKYRDDGDIVPSWMFWDECKNVWHC